MFDKSSDDATQCVSPSIYLEYGVDEDACEDSEINLCERGMRFKSRWQFPLGTELAIALAYHDGEAQWQRIHAEGTIVGCEPLGPKCYQLTLLFVDLSQEFRAALCEVAHSLNHKPTVADA